MINNYFPDECWPIRYMVHYNVIYYVMHAQYILIYLNVIFIKDRMYIFVMKSYPYQIIDVCLWRLSSDCFIQLLLSTFVFIIFRYVQASLKGRFSWYFQRALQTSRHMLQSVIDTSFFIHPVSSSLYGIWCLFVWKLIFLTCQKTIFMITFSDQNATIFQE